MPLWQVSSTWAAQRSRTTSASSNGYDSGREAGMFKALMLREAGGNVTNAIEDVADDQLPPGDVTVAVQYSTLNYKDGLVLGGLGRLVRQYPHVPGVDFVGTVEASRSPLWKEGDAVILTGWRVGETHWGGYAQKARVGGDWLVP